MASDSAARRPILALAPRLRGRVAGVTRRLPAGPRRALARSRTSRVSRSSSRSCCCAGLTNGSIYALVALGYTLVYGILELINFAHGDVFTWGAMITYTIAISWIGLDGSQLGLSCTFGALLVALIGCRGLLRRAQRDDRARRLPALAQRAAAGAADHGHRHVVRAVEPDRRDLRLRLQELQPAPADRRDLPRRQPGLRLGQADRPADHGAGAARRSSGSSRARAGARRCARRRRIATRRG